MVSSDDKNNRTYIFCGVQGSLGHSGPKEKMVNVTVDQVQLLESGRSVKIYLDLEINHRSSLATFQ